MKMRYDKTRHLMTRFPSPCLALLAVLVLAVPTAAEPVQSRSASIADRQAVPVAAAAPRRRALGEPLEGLARQIREINASIGNLGPKNAAALRFLTVSLAAYQRAWAELTRDEIDLDGATGREMVATLAPAQPGAVQPSSGMLTMESKR
jgi:hypothetical protein